MLAGHSAPIHYLLLGRVHLQARASKERSDSRPFSTHTLLFSTVGSLTGYSTKESSVSRPLSTHALFSSSVGFSYVLQQHRRTVLAGHSGPMYYSLPLSGSLTHYSSKGGQC